MSNKAEITSSINNIANGALNPASTVRTTLETLNTNFYDIPNDGTGIIQGFSSVTTLSNISVTKQGSRINISCNVTALVNTVNLIEIVDSEYQLEEATTGNFNQNYYRQCGVVGGGTKTVFVSRYQDDDTRVLCDEALLAGTSLRVNITYNTFE